MKIEKLKQGQAVWVKGFVDSSVFGGCGGFIDFYNKDGNHCGHISRNNVREMKEEDVQIEQPKPVVPQFVAEWYEKHNGYLDGAIKELAYYTCTRKFYTEIEKWFDNTEKPIQTLINMHQFGYTVKKEKLYQIIDKRLNATFSCLGYDIEDRVWFWGNKKFFLKNKGVRLAHTRQQLIDAGFEEVFKNPNYEAPEVTE